MKKIGQYLSCDIDAINKGIKLQHQLISQGSKKFLGEILIDLRSIHREDLNKALISQRLSRIRCKI